MSLIIEVFSRINCFIFEYDVIFLFDSLSNVLLRKMAVVVKIVLVVELTH